MEIKYLSNIPIVFKILNKYINVVCVYQYLVSKNPTKVIAEYKNKIYKKTVRPHRDRRRDV